MKKNSRTIFNQNSFCVAFAFLLLFAVCHLAFAQSDAQGEYPKEVRGYKVTLAKVQVKKQKDAQENKTQGQKNQDKTTNDQASNDTDALVQVGEPRLVSVTPLGVTFEVPVTVAAVKQGGRVDFLVFEDMKVNDTNVTVEDYSTQFDIPNEESKPLPRPIRVFVSTPNTLVNVLGEVTNSKETWPVKGRVYVCGRFNKFIFKFKRAVPIELNLSITNPVNLKDIREKIKAGD
jgi:hypothetical protein